MTPDLNVLLAASRSDHPQHRPAIAWLNRAIADCENGGSIEVLPMVTAGFLRLATNPRVFVAPTPIRAAIAFIDSLLAISGVEIPELGREWPLLRQLSSDHDLAANDMTDAWIAASVKMLGGHLVTFDRRVSRLLSRTEVTVLSPV
jgi:uncharacterized protein